MLDVNQGEEKGFYLYVRTDELAKCCQLPTTHLSCTELNFCSSRFFSLSKSELYTCRLSHSNIILNVMT